LFQLKTSDINGPLSDFQAAVLGNKEEMRRTLRSMNETMGVEGNPNWERTFDVLWPKLEEKLTNLLDQNRIQINFPIEGGILEDAQRSGDKGFTYAVRGTLKSMPKDHSVWILNASKKGEQWPQGSAIYEPASGRWEYGNAKPLSKVPDECKNIATVWARNPHYSP